MNTIRSWGDFARGLLTAFHRGGKNRTFPPGVFADFHMALDILSDTAPISWSIPAPNCCTAYLK